MNISKLKLEETIELLEEKTEKLKRSDISLDDSLKLFEECKKLYDHASSLLTETRQKIEMYNPETKEVEDFSDL